MKPKETKKQRLKLMLLSGKKVTQKWLNQTLDLTNSPELVRQLRSEGMNITTEWKVSENGIRYGVYSYQAPKKVSRITSGAYRV